MKTCVETKREQGEKRWVGGGGSTLSQFLYSPTHNSLHHYSVVVVVFVLFYYYSVVLFSSLPIMFYVLLDKEEYCPETNALFTHVNTSPPHPAMAVNILGPRSLAGLIA